MSFSGERWKAGRSGARRISGTDCGTVGYMLHVLLGDLCTMDAASDGVRLWPTSPPPPTHPHSLVVGFDSLLQKSLLRFVRKRIGATRGEKKFPIQKSS